MSSAKELSIGARYRTIERAIGRDLYKSFRTAVRLTGVPASRLRSERARLQSLKAWMGPFYYQILIRLIQDGVMSGDLRNTCRAKDNVKLARDAIAMVKDWEEECKRWGLLD